MSQRVLVRPVYSEFQWHGRIGAQTVITSDFYLQVPGIVSKVHRRQRGQRRDCQESDFDGSETGQKMCRRRVGDACVNMVYFLPRASDAAKKKLKTGATVPEDCGMCLSCYFIYCGVLAWGPSCNMTTTFAACKMCFLIVA